MGHRWHFAFVVLLVSWIAGCGDNLEPEPDPDQAIAIALETTAPAQVAAGDTIVVNCTLLENDITTAVTADVHIASEASIVRQGSDVIAAKVGMIEVTCALPDRGLVDPTPELVEIIAGPAANVVTTVTPDPVVAGNNVTATCEVYDSYGNPVDGTMPTLQLSPMDVVNTVTDLAAIMIRAGHYTARCSLPGAISNNAGFDVIPALPASLLLARFPDLPVYAVGNVIEVSALVSDRYGNEIYTAPLTRTVTPLTGVGPVVNQGPGEWKFNGEGRYRIDITVDPPTDMDIPLTAFTEVLINSRGPAISCANDASMLNMTPGSSLGVTGNVNDVNGVASLTVNGSPVAVATDGSFSTSITTRFGMNFVDVSATDTFGEPTTKVCTFLVSNRYAATTVPIDDTVSLKLTPSAVDDSDRVGDADSFADLLDAIINSQGMSDTIHASMTAANPLKPHACDSQTCVFGACVCWYSSGVTYLDRDFPGPNTVALSLVTGGVSGGIRAAVHIPNIGVRLRVWGRVSGIPYDTTGWVRISYVNVGVTLDTTLTSGQPNITVRAGSVTTSVGSVTTEFNGVDGWIINNIVVPLAQGYIRDAIRNILRDFVTNNFNSALDGLLAGLDINTLGATFNVPRIDGSGNVPMSFGLRFSTLSTNTSRMQFGIGTRFSTAPANAFSTLGVALPPGVNLLDPTVSAPPNTAVAAHVGVFNGALHALWRANYFGATIDGSVLGLGASSGISIAINTRLPPVAMISTGGVVQLHLGALDLTVQHPDLPPDLSVRLGADAHAAVSLVGNDLVFGGIVIDDLHVSTDSVNLSPTDQVALEDTLTTLAQNLINQSLNNALPALPIPSFTIPASLGAFGLPAGRQLGINSPTLTIAPQHFVLRGQFGLRP